MRTRNLLGKFVGEPKVTKTCEVCSKLFMVHGYRKNTARFCSPPCQASARFKGHNFCVGRKLSKEHKEKIGMASRTYWGARKGKPRPELRGANHPQWKGGTGTKRHQLMSKIEYKLWRIAVFTRDNYTCQMCKTRGVVLEADHIKPWALYPELRYAIDNGRTLCVSCHRQTDTWGIKALQKGIN